MKTKVIKFLISLTASLLLLLLLSLLWTSLVFAEDNVLNKELAASTLLPLEFQFLIESYQHSNLTDKEKNEFIDLIKKLDINLKVLPQKYIYFVIKSEIYKELLENKIIYRNNEQQRSSTSQLMETDEVLDSLSIKKINKLLSNNYLIYTSFGKWLIESLQADIWELTSSKFFDEKLNKNNNSARDKKFLRESEKIEKNKIQNKKKLLTPIYQEVIKKKAEDFNELLKPIMHSILVKLVYQTTIFVNFTMYKFAPKAKAASNLTFYQFDWIDNKSTSPQPRQQKIIGSIIDAKVEGGQSNTSENIEKYKEMKKNEAYKILDSINKESSNDVGDENNEISVEIDKITSSESDGSSSSNSVSDIKTDDIVEDTWVPVDDSDNSVAYKKKIKRKEILSATEVSNKDKNKDKDKNRNKDKDSDDWTPR
ncbi:MAG: hypothetical protein HQK51_03230 [Oligoflexia bacterium]|nr:hypothetical protein [Oligoflexia bacterium]